MKIIFEFLDFLFVIARTALFLIASFAYKFPSNFFPLIPIKIEFLYIFFEFIDADLYKFFLLNLLFLIISLNIFVLSDFDKVNFFYLLLLKFLIYLKKNFFFCILDNFHVLFQLQLKHLLKEFIYSS